MLVVEDRVDPIHRLLSDAAFHFRDGVVEARLEPTAELKPGCTDVVGRPSRPGDRDDVPDGEGGVGDGAPLQASRLTPCAC